MYRVVLHAGMADTPTAGEALEQGIVSATRGQEATVFGPGGQAMWCIEVDTKLDDDDPYYPVIVHRRGSPD
jgi:hypothetical protein